MIHPATGNTITPTNRHSTLIVHDPTINPFRHHHAPALAQTNKSEGQHSNYQPADHLRLRAEGTHHLEIGLNTDLTDRHIHTIRTHRGGIHSEPPNENHPHRSKRNYNITNNHDIQNLQPNKKLIDQAAKTTANILAAHNKTPLRPINPTLRPTHNLTKHYSRSLSNPERITHYDTPQKEPERASKHTTNNKAHKQEDANHSKDYPQSTTQTDTKTTKQATTENNQTTKTDRPDTAKHPHTREGNSPPKHLVRRLRTQGLVTQFENTLSKKTV